MPKTTLATFSDSDIARLNVPLKIGLLGTVNDQGQPHLTLISTLQPCQPRQLSWGQFTEGLCKQYVRQNPKTGFLIMTLDKQLWRGKATFTHTAQQGQEFEMYNNVPMFRYNAYFGIHTVYYMDLVEQTGQVALPMNSIVLAAVKTMLIKSLARKSQQRVLNLWTQQLLNKTGNLKFLAYVGSDGYPVIVPVIQAQALDSARVILSASVYGDELAAIPSRASVAVFGMSLDMEDVLLRGEWRVERVGGVRCGVVNVDWVYNPMPPKPQQIYPELALEPVTIF